MTTTVRVDEHGDPPRTPWVGDWPLAQEMTPPGRRFARYESPDRAMSRRTTSVLRMRIQGIWRYPIKSVGGEALTETEITPVGIRYDRGWGLVDNDTGNVLTARREPKLLMGTARMHDGLPVTTTADGHELRTSDDYAEWLDRPVTLTAAAGNDGGTYEVPLDFENDAEWVSWQGPSDAWHDSTRSRLSLVSTETLGDWDFRRFRTNILLDEAGEDALVGHHIALGGAVLDVQKQIDRCVMVTRPQPGLERDLDVLRTINKERATTLAVGAIVAEPGTIRVGDALTVR